MAIIGLEMQERLKSANITLLISTKNIISY
ncbi:uncharacterized protein FFE2_16040 [Fusarium fujikuroi]|nr:uncharacterized protein FFE2_16040 [Fusarium fujikuroi]